MSEHVEAGFDAEMARVIVESATEFAIIAIDRDGTITIWNPGAEAILGWLKTEAVGMNVRAIFTEEDRHVGAPKNEMDRALSDGRAVNERWHKRKDGSQFWGSGLLMPLRQPGSEDVHGFVKMMRDRTSEREVEGRYHAMRAALPGFVFTADSDGNNTEANELFQTYTGRPQQQLLGDAWLDVIHPDDRQLAKETWEHAVATGETYEARYRFRRQDGQYRCFACRGLPERDVEGRIVRWLGTCIDVENEARARTALERLNITLEHKATQSTADLATAIENLQAEIVERTRVQDALRQAQKMEAVGQLTGGVAHDFNNLLTIIRSSADLLRRPELTDAKRQRYVNAISDTADRAAALTRQLLAFARRQPLQPEAFDAADRVTQVTGILQTTVGSRVTIAVDVTCEECTIQADPNQFETAIVNLVVNARDAMSGEGAIRIAVEDAKELPPRRGHLSGPGDYVAVSITDSGTGIAEDQIAHIFEPFFTTKEVGKGTGLGLSQVFGFAKQSGGDVTVLSTEGAGATFTLFLPRAQAQIEDTSTAAPEQALQSMSHNGCVLVVEDNQAVGEFATQLLEELGYSTTWASNGLAALQLIEEHPDRFDAVFSDVVMPGISGLDLAQRIRNEHPRIPVVLTSGYSHVLAQEGTHGFDLLHKPYSAEGVARILAKVTRAPRPRID